jgi:short-subunit dehydrogenase
MANKQALITGASSGLGAEFARQLASQGYDLILVARREVKLKILASTLMNEFSINAEALVVDLAIAEDIERLEQKILKSAPIDLLINNAGFATVGKFSTIDPVKHRAMISVHVDASVRLCRLVLPSMIERNRGAIINVASVAAFFPATGNSMYSATKAFLVMFTEALHEELRKTNVKVQALCPGFTLTEFHDTPEYNGIDARADIPKLFWMKVDDVVRRSLRDLEKGRVISVPGVVYKAVTALLRNPITAFMIRRLRRMVETGRPLR